MKILHIMTFFKDKARILILLLPLLLSSATPAESKEFERYSNHLLGKHLSLFDYFESPCWKTFFSTGCGRYYEKCPEVASDPKLMPLRMLGAKFTFDSGAGVINTSYPLVQSLPMGFPPQIKLLPSIVGRGWRFEPFSNLETIRPEFLEEAMRVAEFCRDNDDYSAAMNVYEKTIPFFQHKSLSIEYMASLFTESGRLEKIESVLIEEIIFLDHESRLRPKRYPGCRDDIWEELRKEPQIQIKRRYAMVQNLLLARLLDAYLRAGKEDDGARIEKEAMSLDAKFPAESYFFPVLKTYLDLERMDDASRILNAALAQRLKKFGSKSEEAESVLEYFTSNGVPR